MSTGCILLQYPREFDKLHAELTATGAVTIPGSSLRSYGVIDVIEERKLDPVERRPSNLGVA
jgi:hypothetical protein